MQFSNPLQRLATGSRFLNNQQTSHITPKYSKPSISFSSIKQKSFIEQYCKVNPESTEDQICFDCLNNFLYGMSQGSDINKQFIFEQLTAFKNLIDYLLNLMVENNNTEQPDIPEIEFLEKQRFPNGVNRLLEQGNKSLQSLQIVHQSQSFQSPQIINQSSQHSPPSQQSSVQHKSEVNSKLSSLRQSYYSEYERQAVNLETDLQNLIKQS